MSSWWPSGRRQNPGSAVAGILDLDDRRICPIVQAEAIDGEVGLDLTREKCQETQRQTKAWQAKESENVFA